MLIAIINCIVTLSNAHDIIAASMCGQCMAYAFAHTLRVYKCHFACAKIGSWAKIQKYICRVLKQ